MRKIDKEKVKRFVVGTGRTIIGFVGIGAAAVILNKAGWRFDYESGNGWRVNPVERQYGRYYSNGYDSCMEYTYSDAVEAITKSSMLSHHKRAAASAITCDLNASVYQAIMSVARSNMISSDRLNTILNICKGGEE